MFLRFGFSGPQADDFASGVHRPAAFILDRAAFLP